MKNSATKNRIAATEHAAAVEPATGDATGKAWLENTMDSIEGYARREPWPFGFCMLGIGFVLGWKLKIW